jgi:peptidoglycan/LPS O-acetylase OafA/YrhL
MTGVVDRVISSLSIEEQFYLVWPALIIGVLWLSSRRALFSITALITAGSLLFAVWLIFKNETEALFFNSFARFWEISIGALLAIAPAARPQHRAARLCSAGGLV